MVKDLTEKKLHMREMELNSLLEITQAINANLPEDSLYKIYHFTTIASLQIKKLALYVLENEWVCRVNYGTATDFRAIQLPDQFINQSKVDKVEEVGNEFSEFNLIIPIAHKNNPLAYIFLSGEDEGEYIDTAFVQTFTSILVVAIENKRLARKQLQQEVFRKELEIARDVQTMLFPKILPSTDTLKIQATYLPHHTVGGDYYDYIPLDDHRFIICMADVSGKGIPAALLMANFQASLRTLVRKTTDLKEIITELNYIIKNNAKGERFITFFIAIVDMRERYLKYVNAGHNAPILFWANGESEILEKGTIVLGAFDNLPFIEEEIIALPINALLFIYTDGLSEISNSKNEEFDIEKIKAFLASQKIEDLELLHSALLSTIDSFREDKNYPDDITYMSCLIG